MRSINTLNLFDYNSIGIVGMPEDCYILISKHDLNREIIISCNNIRTDMYYLWNKSSLNNGVEGAEVEGERISYL